MDIYVLWFLCCTNDAQTWLLDRCRGLPAIYTFPRKDEIRIDIIGYIKHLYPHL